MNLYPYIQSLRRTGSRAQILVATDNDVFDFLRSKTPTFFEDCGVNLAPIGKFRKTTKRILY